MFARAKGKQQKYVRQLQSVRNSVLIISPIFFSNCRVQFCDNFLGIAAYIFKRSCSSISSLLSSCNMLWCLDFFYLIVLLHRRGWEAGCDS